MAPLSLGPGGRREGGSRPSRGLGQRWRRPFNPPPPGPTGRRSPGRAPRLPAHAARSAEAPDPLDALGLSGPQFPRLFADPRGLEKSGLPLCSRRLPNLQAKFQRPMGGRGVTGPAGPGTVPWAAASADVGHDLWRGLWTEAPGTQRPGSFYPRTGPCMATNGSMMPGSLGPRTLGKPQACSSLQFSHL